MDEVKKMPEKTFKDKRLSVAMSKKRIKCADVEDIIANMEQYQQKVFKATTERKAKWLRKDALMYVMNALADLIKNT